MKAELESFKESLNSLGVQCFESGVSLCVQHCPKCGRDKFKVLFRIVGVNSAPFFGRCQSGSCQTNYSTISYLMALGLNKGQALAAHGMNPNAILQEMVDDTSIEGIINVSHIPSKKQPEEVDNDVSGFFDINDMLESSVSKYAISRGYVTDFKDIIKIDISTDAVVFVIRNDDGGVIGYQRRFLNPLSPAFKTKTSKGMEKTLHLLEFKQDKPLMICEGPFTALSAWHFGFHGVCTFGSGISQTQLENIEKINNFNEIYVAVENDEAGEKFFKKISSYFYWKNIPVYKAISPEGDLNDAWKNNLKIIIEKKDSINPAIPDISINF